MKRTSIRFAFCLAVILWALVADAQLQIPVTEIRGFSHPESVCQSGDILFVSNIGEQMAPLKKDGDGFISKVDLRSGKILDKHYLPSEGGLDAPKGMALRGKILYVADIDHVVGFDIISREKVFDMAFAGTGFLNDLVMGNNKIYASATDNGKIYEIDPEQNTYHALPLKDSITGANGLYYDHRSNTLFCVGIGSWKKPDGMVFAIDLGKMTLEKISAYQGLLDGVDLAGDILYFSDWKGMDKKGNLVALDLQTHQTREVVLQAGGIAGPADFSISEDKRYFIIPATLEGRVIISSFQLALNQKKQNAK